MTERNKNSSEQNTSPRDWHVETIDELTEENLENALNDLDQQGQIIHEIIPHQMRKLEETGRVVAVDITSTLELDSETNSPGNIWHVQRVNSYGKDLEILLQQYENEGWTIFTIIAHRIGKDNFPEVIMHKPR